MFKVIQKYIEDLGEIKSSTAYGQATFEAKTQGIALKYVTQGQEYYQLDKKRIGVSEGQFIIVQHHKAFKAYARKTKSQTKGICIDINPELIFKTIPDLESQEILFGVPFQCCHFVALSQSIQQAGVNLESTTELNLSASLHQIHIDLETFYEMIQKAQFGLSTEVKKKDTQQQLLAKLFEAKDFIHQYYKTAISLKNISRKVGISPYHLNRLFKNCFQQTPKQLQQELRLKTAALLLENKEQSLENIALELGYSDLAAFSNHFKKYHQCSPSQLRKAS